MTLYSVRRMRHHWYWNAIPCLQSLIWAMRLIQSGKYWDRRVLAHQKSTTWAWILCCELVSYRPIHFTFLFVIIGRFYLTWVTKLCLFIYLVESLIWFIVSLHLSLTIMILSWTSFILWPVQFARNVAGVAFCHSVQIATSKSDCNLVSHTDAYTFF